MNYDLCLALRDIHFHHGGPVFVSLEYEGNPCLRANVEQLTRV